MDSVRRFSKRIFNKKAQAPDLEEASGDKTDPKPAEVPEPHKPKKLVKKTPKAPKPKVPKAEVPKDTKPPKEEAPKGTKATKPKAPKTDAPKAEVPKETKPPKAPKIDVPKAEASKDAKPPKVEAPKGTKATKPKAPKTDAPKAEVPKETKPPKAPKIDVPKAEAPKETKPPQRLRLKAPKAEVPKTEGPKETKPPKVEAPKLTKAPKRKASKTDVPKAEGPKDAKLPRVEAPKEQVTEAKAGKTEAKEKPKTRWPHWSNSKPLLTTPTGSTQTGGTKRKADSQPDLDTPRKLQKKPTGTSSADVPENLWHSMKPIGEYPAPGEYRSAGVVPKDRVAPPADPSNDFDFDFSSDSGAENPTSTFEDVVRTPKEKTLASTLASSPDADTRMEATPTFASAIDPKNPDYQAILKSLPLPSSDTYDVLKLRNLLKYAIMHALEMKSPEAAVSILHFWHIATTSTHSHYLGLIKNLGEQEKDEIMTEALQYYLKEMESSAVEWFQSYIGAPPVELPSGSESALSSPKSGLNERGFRFKMSDLYRDTTGPRLEENFLSGKSNTAPLKRPKKACPVNEKAYKRKHQWETDANQDSMIQEKRARYAAAQPTFEETATYSSHRDERGPPDAIEHPYTVDESNVIERSRSLPVGGSILDSTTQGPVEGTHYSLQPPVATRKAKKKSLSKAQKAKNKRPEPAQRARSLSVDTTISSLSSLSNSAYSVRLNDWTAEHETRQNPNTIPPPDSNSDECNQCGIGGNLICCDTCVNSYHCDCLDPPLKSVPDGEWSCPKCTVRNSFSTLIAHGKHSKKTEFSLPKNIKEHFVGVSEGVAYDAAYARNLKHQRYYKPAPHLPRLTKEPKQDAPTVYANPMLLREFDNKGESIRCYKCGLSSQGIRPIITCDYCPCRFHLDCLDPPRAQPPNAKVGWMCPNHVTSADMIATKEVDGNDRVRRVRRTKNMSYIDCDILLPDDPNQTLFDDEWKESRSRVHAGDIVFAFIDQVKNDNNERQAKFAQALEKKCLDLTRQITQEYLERQGVAGAKELTEQQRHPAFLAENVSGTVAGMVAGTPGLTGDLDAASVLLALSRSGTGPSLTESEPVLRPIPAMNPNKRSRDDQELAEEPAQKRPHTDSE